MEYVYIMACQRGQAAHEIHSDKDGVIKYRTCVDSKISPGWKKWEPTREIKFSELVVEMRDDKIKRILE